ncbi:MARCH2 [Acanthosepion pharaonis]|uniref:MARCH2 n=1 Tax=Acanthosepion pharaonis TaxID=158019 RepID=A0A812E2V9_ACAPH|nr:MARCH2 [Sepia pharaonis]
MSSSQVHCINQDVELSHLSNTVLPVNDSDEQHSLSDVEEMPANVNLSSADDSLGLEKTSSGQLAQLSSSQEESIPSSIDLPSAYIESETTNPPNPAGRLQRWKYRLLGQSKVNTTEKNTNGDCPISTANEERKADPFLVRKLFGNGVDTANDISDLDVSVPKVNTHGCSLVCLSGKDEYSRSISRSTFSDSNISLDQSDNEVKGKHDSLKDTINGDYMDYDCRICHGGTSSGQLVSPCYCTGTMGQMHVACLEQWLGSNGRKECELCGYRYHLCREPRSFREFLKNPGAPNLARHLKCDLFCFAVLTPTTLISVSLLLFAANLLEWQMTWSVVGLITTAIFLVIIYVFWSVMAFTYQRKIWQKWKLSNQVVRLKCTSKCSWDYNESHPAATGSERSLNVVPVYPRASTVTITSTEVGSDIDARLFEIRCNESEPSVSPYISLDPYRLSQSFSDIRMALPSVVVIMYVLLEPSLVMDTDLRETAAQNVYRKTFSNLKAFI